MNGDAVVRPLAPRRERRWAQWPLMLVLTGVGIAMAVIAFGSFRRGCVVLAAAILMGAFLRLFLSDQDAGWLAVRKRSVDVGVLLTLGIGLAVLSFWVPAPS